MAKLPVLSASASTSDNLRDLIAQRSAQLILEEGIHNYDTAKRKAARQLDCPEGTPLPSQREIIDAIRIHQDLFATEDAPTLLRAYREQALRWLNRLAPFQPVLSGLLAEGIATEQNGITIELRDPDSKSLELLLINQSIPFRPNDPPRKANRNGHLIQSYTIEEAGVPIHLLLRTSNGRSRPHQESKNSKKRTTITAKKLAEMLNETPPPLNTNLTSHQ